MTTITPPTPKITLPFPIAMIWLTLTLAAARAGLIINRFDSAAEVAAWRYDGGLPGGTFTFDPNADAGGSPARGAMELVLPFTSPGGFEFTLDKFPVAANLTAGLKSFAKGILMSPNHNQTDRLLSL